MAKKTFDDVKKEVRHMVSEAVRVPEAQLTDSARFAEDLDVDSMMALEIIASLEKKFKVIVPEEDIPRMTSMKNVYEWLGENKKALGVE